MTTHPLTGRPYTRAYFDVQMVDTLLLLVGSPCPMDVIGTWSKEQLEQAGDWALRSHLRASDNGNRVPPKPAHVTANRQIRNTEICTVFDGTVFDLVNLLMDGDALV